MLKSGTKRIINQANPPKDAKIEQISNKFKLIFCKLLLFGLLIEHKTLIFKNGQTSLNHLGVI
jgi:hypothetical protein